MEEQTNPNIALTITNDRGQKICEREVYALGEILTHPGMSSAEVNMLREAFPFKSFVWFRGGSRFLIEVV